MTKRNDRDLEIALQEVFTSEEEKQLLADVDSLRSVSVPHPSLKVRLLSQTKMPPRRTSTTLVWGAIAFCSLALFLVSRPLWEETRPVKVDNSRDYVVLLDALAPELFAEDYLYFEDPL